MSWSLSVWQVLAEYCKSLCIVFLSMVLLLVCWWQWQNKLFIAYCCKTSRAPVRVSALCHHWFNWVLNLLIFCEVIRQLFCSQLVVNGVTCHLKCVFFGYACCTLCSACNWFNSHALLVGLLVVCSGCSHRCKLRVIMKLFCNFIKHIYLVLLILCCTAVSTCTTGKY